MPSKMQWMKIPAKMITLDCLLAYTSPRTIFSCKRQAGIRDISDILKRDDPEFLAFKTTRFHHLLEDMLNFFDNLKMISIVRHPCGAINSWLNTPSEFSASADSMKEWRTGNCRKTAKEEFWGFDDWKKVTLMHMDLEQKYNKQFKIIKFEQLVSHPLIKTEELFSFVGLDVEDQTRKFISECHSRHDQDSYSVYKQKSVAVTFGKTVCHWKFKKEIIGRLKERRSPFSYRNERYNFTEELHYR
jgi:hypothetical protein